MDIQTKFKATMEAIAKDRGLELVESSNWANTGMWMFQLKGSFKNKLKISYNFQSSYASFTIGSQEMTARYEDGGLDSIIGHVKNALIY